ncbi:MAG: sulfatase [Thermoanaerobaculia bacterium]|nr:sulfatase [Thermoanaerobaculia bacterium]
MTGRPASPACLLTTACLACAPGADAPDVIRLVDELPLATLRGTPEVTAEGPGDDAWSFDDPEADAPEQGWVAAHGIEDLRVADGGLAGRSSDDIAILRVERGEGLDDPDELHAIEVRMRASAGSELSLQLTADEELDVGARVDRLRDGGNWVLRAPLLPGDEVQTYTIAMASTPLRQMPTSSGIRHLLLRPTDVAGADFAIESVRLVFRRQHFASIPSGMSFQGLDDIYRETIVARSPETLSFEVVIPENAWLELHLATLEDHAVTFRVEAGDGAEVATLLQRTLTTPRRWESTPIELAGLEGPRTLRLSVDADAPGSLGYWGTPVIRRRGAEPRTVADTGDRRPPRGVILLVADTLRRDHLDFYGYGRETTPNLSAAAAEGVVFTDNISQASWTKVSMSSMLTSLYPTSHGIDDPNDRISSVATTIGEAYREAGYATVSIPSNGFAGRMSNLHQGFETAYEPGSVREGGPGSSSKTARASVDRLLDWLDDHHDAPFFAFMLVLDPHSPFEPRRPYDTTWADPAELPAFKERMEKVKEHIERDFMRRQSLPTREEMEAAGIAEEDYVPYELDWYDGSIRGMDVEIGRLFERLRELGIADDTLVAFIADHGEEFLEHGRHWHGNTIYGEMINVPLALHWPAGLPRGKVIDDTVQSIDLMPTLLELSGLEAPAAAQGTSLVPLIYDTGPAGRRDRPIVSEHRIISTRAEDREEAVQSESIIVGEWKLIRNFERPEGWPEFELYHHRDDPLDRDNVADENPKVVAELSARLDAWREWAEGAKLPSDAEASAEMSAEELARLRALGYI